MFPNPVFSGRASARAVKKKTHGGQGVFGSADHMQEFDDRAERPDDIGEDSYPWHQLRCRETALFIEETY